VPVVPAELAQERGVYKSAMNIKHDVPEFGRITISLTSAEELVELYQWTALHNRPPIATRLRELLEPYYMMQLRIQQSDLFDET
jgi:hypothetical protein